jgi:hypothetical protein
MRKYKFIHPVTGEAHIVICDKVEGYQEANEMFHRCAIRRKTVAFIPISYAMIRIDE